jgi:hypothetical protein
MASLHVTDSNAKDLPETRRSEVQMQKALRELLDQLPDAHWYLLSDLGECPLPPFLRNLPPANLPCHVSQLASSVRRQSTAARTRWGLRIFSYSFARRCLSLHLSSANSSTTTRHSSSTHGNQQWRPQSYLPDPLAPWRRCSLRQF